MAEKGGTSNSPYLTLLRIWLHPRKSLLNLSGAKNASRETGVSGFLEPRETAMGRCCTVCRHAQRGELEAALEVGTPLRDIAGHFNVSKSAVERHHRRHSAPPTTVPGHRDEQAREPENRAAEGTGREAPPPVLPTPSGGRKTYRCDRYPGLSIGGRLQFEHGDFQTADPIQQQLIERSERFAGGFIQIVEEPDGNPAPDSPARCPGSDAAVLISE
jgi:hypothetical protein